jgi:hypothetical protein
MVSFSLPPNTIGSGSRKAFPTCTCLTTKVAVLSLVVPVNGQLVLRVTTVINPSLENSFKSLPEDFSRAARRSSVVAVELLCAS